MRLEGDFSPENQGGDLKGKPDLKDLTIFLGREGRADSTLNTPGKGGWGWSHLSLLDGFLACHLALEP